MVQQLTFNTNRSQLLLYGLPHQDSSKRKESISEIHKIRQTNSSIYDSLLKRKSSCSKQTNATPLTIEARKKYNQKVDEYLQKILTGQPVINTPLSLELEAAFTNYQNNINHLFLSKNDHVQSVSNRYTSETHTKSLLISSFAALPFILIILFVGVLLVEMRSLFSGFSS